MTRGNDALGGNLAQLRLMLDGLGRHMFVGLLDPHGVLLFANKSALEAAGVQADAALGRPFEDTVWWSYSGGVRQRVRAAVARAAGGESVRYDEQIHTADGEIVWIDFSLHPLRDEAGDIVFLVPSAILITERKRTENALHEQAALLANAQRIGRMGSWSLDIRTGRLIWPEATCRLFGIARAEFTGSVEQFRSFILPEDLPVYDAATARLSVSEPLYEAEYRIRRPDGVVRWMYSRGDTEFDAAGAPVCRVGMVMDITEQRTAREQLEQNAALLRTAGRVARLGGWTIQLPERALTWSDENCAIHDVPPGYRPTLEEGIGYYPPEYRADVLAHVAACETDGTPYDFELPKLTATGRRIWVRSIGEAVRGADGTIIRLQGAFQDISERKRAEEALRESEAEFRALAESMPQMVWMTRPDGSNIYFNQRWVDYTGLTRAESAGHGWHTPFHPNDRQRERETWQRALTGGEYSVESRLRRADGVYRWMLIRGLPFRGPDGQITKWIGTCTDIDDLKRAQELALDADRAHRELAAQLQTERARLVAAQAVASIGSWETDLATLAVIWSAETYRIFETTPERFQPTHPGFLQLIHPDDRIAVDQAFVQSQDRRTPGVIEHRLLMPDGRLKFVEERWQIVRDEEGRPVRATGTCQDITERRRVQEEIRQKDALIRIAGRVTHTGGWAMEMPDQRVFWSDEMFDILEHPRGSVPPHADAVAFYLDQWRDEVVAAIRGCASDGTPFDLEAEILTAKGRRKWVRVSGEAERRADGSIARVQGAFQDITERKHLEQQYLRAQRVESIGTLAGGIAHDLNNVLTPILLSIGLLHDGEHDEARLETLATIEASAKRGAEMVSQVLSFARGLEGRRVEVALEPLVKELIKIVRDTFPKDIGISERLSPDLWRLWADPTQIHQVLINLCVNARDAMPAGGQITITAGNVLIDERDAAGDIESRVGPHVKIEIRDTGTGIPKEIIDKIFDPFFTTKDIGKGTGLGLATSLVIVRSHGGFIRAYSEPGMGTCFCLYLPAHTAPVSVAAAPAEANGSRGHGETILVVDDEALIREIARRTLEANGYRVLLAADGVEAVALYRKHQPIIAVVVTDMMMPVMGGAETIEALKRLNPEVRIIGASGLAVSPDVASATGPSLQSFLAKPFTAETLLGAIETALSQ